MKKIISVVTVGLDDDEAAFVSDTVTNMAEIIDAYQIKKWADFEFYCSYGYFEDDRLGQA